MLDIAAVLDDLASCRDKCPQLTLGSYVIETA